jgi:hypothetical protein
MARRQLLVGLSLAAAALATPGLAAITPRQRIIIDNDFGGDPDGLFQLAHHLASPSVEIALSSALICMTRIRSIRHRGRPTALRNARGRS